MIYFETERLTQMMSAVDAANEQIDTAAVKLQKITTHEDWGCKERHQINEMITEIHKHVKTLQSSNRSFTAAVRRGVDGFLEKEKALSSLFETVEAVLGGFFSATGSTVGSVIADVASADVYTDQNMWNPLTGVTDSIIDAAAVAAGDPGGNVSDILQDPLWGNQSAGSTIYQPVSLDDVDL